MPQLGRFAPGLAFGGRKYNSTPTPTPTLTPTPAPTATPTPTPAPTATPTPTPTRTPTPAPTATPTPAPTATPTPTPCPSNGTYLGAGCNGQQLYYTYANGSCGSYNTNQGYVNGQCGYFTPTATPVPPTPTPVPTATPVPPTPTPVPTATPVPPTATPTPTPAPAPPAAPSTSISYVYNGYPSGYAFFGVQISSTAYTGTNGWSIYQQGLSNEQMFYSYYGTAGTYNSFFSKNFGYGTYSDTTYCGALCNLASYANVNFAAQATDWHGSTTINYDGWYTTDGSTWGGSCGC